MTPPNSLGMMHRETATHQAPQNQKESSAFQVGFGSQHGWMNGWGLDLIACRDILLVGICHILANEGDSMVMFLGHTICDCK